MKLAVQNTSWITVEKDVQEWECLDPPSSFHTCYSESGRSFGIKLSNLFLSVKSFTQLLLTTTTTTTTY